ncbi:alpha/beta fold hydrolase [Pseudonocardia alaniniphila]|uniref:Alpha/beta hydrolase n=1 Tax=Pseudonocardia alaniniphila TaxID=75291 RepID=A0ABS9TAC5_9PSEU|nr:alpha/beta fold hydrolase [Pseudonocardia alaniniphila]MCH6165472.1 alpha/beta hydrolase [Pseudonocardia alaniniphila]
MARHSDGSSLLFLHPVGLDRRCVEWLDLPPVRAVTMPGHGERERARPGLTLADMADEIVGHSTGPLDVVGASLGGMVAMHLALGHPDRVRSLVLACTTPRGDSAVMNDRADATEDRGSAGMLEDTLTRWFTPAALEADRDTPYMAYARERLLAMDPGALADTWRAIGTHDVLDRLGEIRVPTTCIAGTRDLSTPMDVMRDLAARLPDARLVEMDAPHMAFLERPREFSVAVLEHLAWAGAQEGALR